ncbi:flagellar hook protein FlgE [Delftia tsuruhatensis]|uniref:Flagellar hook protein FlgE n=1 Tax=Delftia tsuruhatensis TaxID=180282 RepID=A0ABN4SQP1_9BURK|nr:flagellar hook protein FlgE [Delftia tsuruhatensis]AOV04319.1 flagellar biosynthesis protein FlgE [Delftia tsuruhatensis]MDH2231612.1 flagellar hook protein FlgE [Delftia tsuruhatensis]
MGFQQGLSGLNAASKNLDVIGHNIANANTTGFKSSRAEFAEAVASAVGSASGQTSGIGVNVAAVTQQFRQGPITTTGNNLDVAINGNGFFVVRQPDGSTAYTRAGSFGLDKQGNLKTVQGDNVMGYPVDATTGKVLAGGQPVPMVFPSGQPIAAKTTTKIDVNLNLDARATVAAGDATKTPPIPATPRATYGTSVNVYDSQGVATPVQMYFEKGATPNTWVVYDGLDDPTATPPKTANVLATLNFDAAGKLNTVAPNPAVATIQTNNPNSPTPGTVSVTLDFSSVTQFGTKFAVSSLKQDGYTAGALTGINVGNDGSIVATYSNGVTRTEGQLALAAFTNTQGLGAVGDNKWVETSDSGPALNGTAQSGTFGSLRSGALEDSNVDLTAELVNMMTAQRAYQANAQTIKTQDQVFSTLVNLR